MYIYICIYLCIYVFTCMYIYIYIYTYWIVAGGINLKRLYKFYDRNNDGTMNFQEFRTAVRKQSCSIGNIYIYMYIYISYICIHVHECQEQ